MIGLRPLPDEGNRVTPLAGLHITPRRLYGLFFEVLKQHHPAGAEWLHDHPAPKPYSLTPYYLEDGQLVGLRISTFTQQVCQLIASAWGQSYHAGHTYRLGWQTVIIGGFELLFEADFFQLAQTSPNSQMALHFLSPTSFKQGPGSLPLPLPANVFRSPYLVWQAFAPEPLTLPDDWLEWCAACVFVTAHQLETAQVALNRGQLFTGFVGQAVFTAKSKESSYLSIWQALGQVAAFCGVGRKTTMGMGAVDRVK